MPAYDIRPIPQALAHSVRVTLRDPIYDLPVRIEPATGYGPCRLCLRTFSVGEPRILFLYNPFSTSQEADVAGPIFIHADDCRPYAQAAFPAEIAALPVVLRAYDRDRRCIAEIIPTRDDVDGQLEALLAQRDVEVVHVRNAEAKCFIAVVHRAAASAGDAAKARDALELAHPVTHRGFGDARTGASR